MLADGTEDGVPLPAPLPLSQRLRLVRGAGLAARWPPNLAPSSAEPGVGLGGETGADGVTHRAGSLPGPTHPSRYRVAHRSGRAVGLERGR